MRKIQTLPSRVGLSIVVIAGFGYGAPSPSVASIEPCDEQIVMQVDAAKITPESKGFMVDVFGVSESAGWKHAKLVPVGASRGVATVDFVACRPQVSAQVLTPIQATTRLELNPATRRIIIRARTNSMTVDIGQQ